MAKYGQKVECLRLNIPGIPDSWSWSTIDRGGFLMNVYLVSYPAVALSCPLDALSLALLARLSREGSIVASVAVFDGQRSGYVQLNEIDVERSLSESQIVDDLPPQVPG